MSSTLSDIRFALRLLGRSPGYFSALIGILVAGIAATTAMFSIVRSLLLQPLPYRDPEQLTMIWRVDPRIDPGPTSVANFLDWRSQATSFTHMAAIEYAGVSLSSVGAKPVALPGTRVSGDFFPMFGITALAGRLLGPEDDQVGGPRVAVVSAALWRRRFGADPGLVGRTITLNSEAFTVVGVAAEGFQFSGPNSDHVDVWTPLAVTSAWYQRVNETRGNSFLHVIGRRKPGVSLADAQAELKAISKRLEEMYPDTNAKKSVRLADLQDELVGSSRSGVWVLFGAVALVFAVVCANVASLLLTRAQSRRAEMALRAALGATRARLLFQILTETMVVFLLGAAGGFIASHWLVDLFAAGLVSGGARTIPIRVDSGALAFCIVSSLACGVLFGLIPALSVARIEPHTLLKETGPRAGGGRAEKVARGALVVAEVALSCALLAGSALALKAFAKTASLPPGFDPEGLATAKIVLPGVKYPEHEQAVAFYDEVLRRVRAEPGVIAAAGNDALPMGGSNSSGSFEIEGRPPWPRGDQPNIERNIVTPGYFATMKIPILRGREFTDADRANTRLVMIISQAAAERFFPGEDPIGKRIDWGTVGEDGEHYWREIVGVAGDVRRRGLAQSIVPESYGPLTQHRSGWMAVAIRAQRPEAVLEALPGIVQGVDPDQAVSSSRLMVDRVAEGLRGQRYVVVLLGAFAVTALLLASVGIFGLVAYSTAQRTREIGIRMALGATPEAVVALVMKGGARLVGAGLAAGLVCALLVGRLLASRVPGVSAFDLAVYSGIPAVLAVSGLVACLVPAWRAVRVPPAIALRYE